MQFLRRGDIPDPEGDIRRSDFLVPNGYYSDLILLIWGILSLVFLVLCTLIKDWQGMWILVFVSFLVIVSILKVVDLVGRKFGYNILGTNQEMSFYPIRLVITNDERHWILNFIFSTQIPTVSNFILPRGFAFNLFSMIWAVVVFFILQFWDSLLITGKMSPKYEPFVNTRQDLIDRGMTLG